MSSFPTRRVSEGVPAIPLGRPSGWDGAYNSPFPGGECNMANLQKRLPENVPGDFFVDSTCIDCDTCRQLAPQVFAEGDEHAYVHEQPASAAARRAALHALVS